MNQRPHQNLRPAQKPIKQMMENAEVAAKLAEQPVAMPSNKEPPKKGSEGKRVITLDYPVDFAGDHYPTLTVRRVKAKDFRQLDMITEGGNAAAIAMAALICNVDEAIIDELDATDYLKVQEAIADFFPKALVDRLRSTDSGSSQT